jgi:hypothetical protein
MSFAQAARIASPASMASANRTRTGSSWTVEACQGLLARNRHERGSMCSQTVVCSWTAEDPVSGHE